MTDASLNRLAHRHTTVHFMMVEQPIIIDVHGGLEGRYVVEERRADGAVVIRPDLSVESILARHGERQVTRDEVPIWLRELLTDDEG